MNRIALLSMSVLLVAGCRGESTGRDDAAATAADKVETRPAPQTPPPLADVVRVRLTTEAGPIVLALDGKRAPLTAANFLAYVDGGRFDGTTFYRAARTKGADGRGFIQGGIRRNYRLMLPPVEHEPTSKTGLRHEAGTISMARSDTSGAMGNFFITAARMPAMDASGGDQGFAAFGRVEEGMDVVRRILAAPTIDAAGAGAMRGQMLAAPVTIVSARRAD